MKPILTLILLLAGISLCAQPAQNKSRLLGTAVSKYDQLSTWLQSDSTAYQYTSGYGVEERKYTELTDIAWKADTTVFYKFDIPTSKYQPFTRKIILFNAQQIVAEKLQQSYTTGNWANTAKYTYTYIGTNLIGIVKQNFFANQWENQSRNTYAYNSNNELVTSVNEYWDGGINQWAPSTLVNSMYNTAGQLIEVVGKQYNNNQWQEISKDGYHYAVANNQLDTLVSYNWDINTLQWRTVARYTLKYNIDNLREEDFYDFYNTTTATWDTISKRSYIYDADTNIASQTLANWKNGSYQNTGKNAYSYNKYHQVATVQFNTWDSTLQKFVDTTGNTATRHYYEFHPDNIDNDYLVVTTNMMLFPNPACDEINLEILFTKAQAFNIAVYDAIGKLVKQYNTTHAKEYHNRINTADMPAGNYILKLNCGTEEIINRFAIVR